MSGNEIKTDAMFVYLSPESFVPKEHPLRPIRTMVDAALARLYKKSKGKESRMSLLGHALMENRNGLIVDGVITRATGTAEREAAVEMVANVASNRMW